MEWYFLMDDVDCNWLWIKNASKPRNELCLFLRKLNLKKWFKNDSKMCNIEQQNIFFHSLMEN